MTKTDKPLVSVALCTYNGERFLRQQIQSIVDQDYENLEIVICDDQSTDQTVNLCKKFAADNPQIKLFTNDKNLGYVKNFEKAIKLCTGDFIALCDQDDVWRHNKLTCLVENINDDILIYHDSDFIDEDSNKLTSDTMASRYRMYEGNSALPFLIANCISGHASMFQKRLLEYIFPFDIRFPHDWWIAYVAVNVGKIKFLPDILVSYRQHQKSVTDNLNLKIKKLENLSPIKRLTVDEKWLAKCHSFTYNKEPDKIHNARKLLSNIEIGNNKLQLFIFIVKNFDELFFIIKKKKSFFSKINYARKIAFF